MRHTTGCEFNRESTTKCVTFKPAIHVVLKGLTLCHYQAMSQQTTQQKPFTTTQSVNAVTYRAPFTVLVLRWRTLADMSCTTNRPLIALLFCWHCCCMVSGMLPLTAAPLQCTDEATCDVTLASVAATGLACRWRRNTSLQISRQNRIAFVTHRTKMAAASR